MTPDKATTIFEPGNFFVVTGIPAPQGSKRPVRLGNGKLGMVESSAKVKPWRDAVNAVAKRACRAPLTGPVHLELHFLLPRPVSLPRNVLSPVKYPDLDKLVRSTMDGLAEGGAFLNDSQVVVIVTSKAYVPVGSEPGCLITIREL